ncbi:MAG: hypothetical protein ACE14L_09520 [Terriglobales bacterium]
MPAPQAADKAQSEAVMKGFHHDGQAGRVECEACGTRAFSRSPIVIAQWQLAHARFCKGAATVPPDPASSVHK